MGEDEDNIQLALAKAILNGESSSKEIKMNSIKRFGEREWDTFETHYRDRLNAYVPSESKNTALAVEEVKSVFHSIFDEETVASTEVEPFAFIADFKEPKAPTKQASQPISLGLFGFDDDGEISNDKIVIYKRVKKGNRTVEQRMEVSRAEIDEMVGAIDSAPMQLSLF